MSLLLDIKFDNPQETDIFSKALPDMQIIDWRTEKQNKPDLTSVRYALVWLPDEGLLASLPNLEVIFSAGAGVDHIFADGKLPNNIPIVRFVDPDLRDRMSEWIVCQATARLCADASSCGPEQCTEFMSCWESLLDKVLVSARGMGAWSLWYHD